MLNQATAIKSAGEIAREEIEERILLALQLVALFIVALSLAKRQTWIENGRTMRVLTRAAMGTAASLVGRKIAVRPPTRSERLDPDKM